MAKKDIEKVKGGALAVADYGEDVGGGFENQGQEDIMIPFVGIIQDMSPHHKKSKPEYIEGAEVGMLYNTVTDELLPNGQEFVPALTEQVFVEWQPRDSGGGFVARHELTSPVVQKAKANCEFGKLKTENGNDLVGTFYVYGILVSDKGDISPAIIAFTSTKIKVYRKWMTKVRAFQITLPDGRKQNPPLFAHRIRLSTVEEKNNKGEFYNFGVEPAEGDMFSSLLTPDDARFQAAKQLKQLVQSGAARAAEENVHRGEASEDDNIPF